MILYLKRNLNNFAPAWTDDLEQLQKLSHDTVYKCSVTRPRNIKHHRKFRAFLTLVFKALPESMEGLFLDIDALHTELKLQVGYYDIHKTIGGKEFPQVKSTSFDKMNQDQFEIYYDKCIAVVCKHILPGMTKEEIISQIIEF